MDSEPDQVLIACMDCHCEISVPTYGGRRGGFTYSVTTATAGIAHDLNGRRVTCVKCGCLMAFTARIEVELSIRRIEEKAVRHVGK